jgi:N-acetylmuramic acid 6-phosphate etherase
MVGVVPGNEKLRERAARIIADLAGVSIEAARRRLDEAGGDVAAALAAERRA